MPSRKQARKRGKKTHKDKGQKFERKMCRKLTKWITGLEHPEIFWRSATSGAKATQDARHGRKSGMGGDLVATDPRGTWFAEAYSVEFKDRKSYGPLELLMGGKGGLLKWWQQTVRDAIRSNRRPLLIFKQLFTPVFVAFIAKPLNGENISAATGGYIKFRIPTDTKVNDSMCLSEVTICELDTFLRHNPAIQMQLDLKRRHMEPIT